MKTIALLALLYWPGHHPTDPSSRTLRFRCAPVELRP